jgi:hypothetical protein
MPRGGSKPSERRGGRKKGTPNKYTIGQAWKARQPSQKLTIGRVTREMRGYTAVDGRLELLRWAIETCVPDPEHRSAVGLAIDQYIEARERASKKEVLGRAVTKPPPPPKPEFDLMVFDQRLVVPDFTGLDLGFDFPPDSAL